MTTSKMEHNEDSNQHIKSVSKQKRPFECAICTRSFKTKYYMNIHISSVHEGKKPFKCDYDQCKFSSAFSKCLKIHVAAVHERKKDFKCYICEKSFCGARELTNTYCVYS